MGKNSFILYQSYYEILKELTDMERGQILNAIFIYEIENRVIDLSPVLKMAFAFIKKDLDSNKEKYQKTVEKNRDNAYKRWSDSKKDTEKSSKNATASDCINSDAKNATAFSKMRPHAKHADDVDVDVDGDDNEDDKEKEKDKGIFFKEKNNKKENMVRGVPVAVPAERVACPVLETNVVHSRQGAVFEYFNSVYKKSIGIKYAYKAADFINLARKIKEFGEDIVKQKIDKFNVLCSSSEPPQWWCKGGVSDFTIENLIRHWNKIVDIESNAEREKRRLEELTDKKLRERGLMA